MPRRLHREMELSRIGIDSMLIAEIVDDIEHALDVVVPFREVLGSRTLGDVVDVVCADRGA